MEQDIPDSLKGLKVCMATSAHPTWDDRIFFKEARSLRKVGCNVTVLHGVDEEPPEERFGVEFRGYQGGGGLGARLCGLRRMEAELRKGCYDVIHAHEPEVLIAALKVKKRTGCKVIFDSHEMWGAVAAGRFPKMLWGVVERGYKMCEKKWIGRCDAAIGASWSISDYLRTILGEAKVATILNVPVAEVFGEFGGREWGESTILCHDGHMTFNRGLKVMANAVRIVSERFPVQFKIVGDVFGEERRWLDGFIDAHDLQGVITRTGWLDYREVGAALANCHVGLIGYQKTPNNIVTSSNKVFNYMLYGMPFVGPEFRIAKQRLVENERCGVLADSTCPVSFATSINEIILNRQLRETLGKNALIASRERYRWEHMEPILFGLYDRVL